MRRFNWRRLTLLVSIIVLLGGCSLQKMALDQTASILKGAMPAFEKDKDYHFVEQSLPGSIKMVEGFLEAGPDNQDLLLMASQAYMAYGLLFIEDRLGEAEEDSPAEEQYLARAKEMYRRSHNYGLRLLETQRPGFTAAFAKGGEDLTKALAACQSKEDAAGIFWVGMPLAAAVNLSRDDVAMIAMLPKVKALIARTLELDESYYHAGAHMILGSLDGSTPKMLGGDTEKAKKHFSRALELTKRRFLLVQVMMAQTLAVQLQDQALFKKLLDEVLKAPLSIDPKQQLANVAAKRKAKRLLKYEDELF